MMKNDKIKMKKMGSYSILSLHFVLIVKFSLTFGINTTFYLKKNINWLSGELTDLIQTKTKFKTKYAFCSLIKRKFSHFSLLLVS